MALRKRVIVHRSCAVVWTALLLPALLWWRESVMFVIIASVYANIKSDWSASEAADNSQVLARLDREAAKSTLILQRLTRMEAMLVSRD